MRVPKEVEAILRAFDARDTHFSEQDVLSALIQARSALTAIDGEEQKGAWAEVLAFALTPSRTGGSPWRTYFGPTSSVQFRDGRVQYAPDIAEADPQFIAHWDTRARGLKHPVLKARYADLAWDMSRAIAKARPDPAMARIAIDAYLEQLARRSYEDVHSRLEASIRALDLAVSLRDVSRIEGARKALLSLHRSVMEVRGPLWWRALDRLLDDRNAGVTDQERAQLVRDLQDIATFHSDVSDPSKFDPHAAESAIRRLTAHLNRTGRRAELPRWHELLARTFEHFASLGNAMIASSALQTATNAYRDAGLEDESERTRAEMEAKIEASRGEMVSFSAERTIPRDTMEAFLESVVLPELPATFVRLASEFLERRSDLEARITELAETAPLSAAIPHQIISDNRVTAVVGSVEDDPSGRLVVLAAQYMSFADVWLVEALRRTVEVHHVVPEHIVTWSARKRLFDDLSLLREGVIAWYDGDYTKAIHVLVPQIERGLRGIAAALGKPTTKAHPTIKGASVAINMGDILYSPDITEALGPDVTLHFRALYADPRGFNLRNELAHGLLSPDAIHVATASRLIHSLLILGIWEELANARRRRAC